MSSGQVTPAGALKTTFTTLKPPRARPRSPVEPSPPPPSALAATGAPAASGTSTLVTVRSNASDECSTEPAPPPAPAPGTAPTPDFSSTRRSTGLTVGRSTSRSTSQLPQHRPGTARGTRHARTSGTSGTGRAPAARPPARAPEPPAAPGTPAPAERPVSRARSHAGPVSARRPQGRSSPAAPWTSPSRPSRVPVGARGVDHVRQLIAGATKPAAGAVAGPACHPRPRSAGHRCRDQPQHRRPTAAAGSPQAPRQCPPPPRPCCRPARTPVQLGRVMTGVHRQVRRRPTASSTANIATTCVGAPRAEHHPDHRLRPGAPARPAGTAPAATAQAPSSSPKPDALLPARDRHRIRHPPPPAPRTASMHPAAAAATPRRRAGRIPAPPPAEPARRHRQHLAPGPGRRRRSLFQRRDQALRQRGADQPRDTGPGPGRVAAAYTDHGRTPAPVSSTETGHRVVRARSQRQVNNVSTPADPDAAPDARPGSGCAGS